MSGQIHRVALIGKPDCPGTTPVLRALGEHLALRGLTVVVEHHHSLPGVPSHPLWALADHTDLAVVVGGDGTFLLAAGALSPHDIPLIGVNLGRVGFLTDLAREEVIVRLDEVLAGRFEVEDRLMLTACSFMGEVCLAEGLALNDVVIHRGDGASMVEIVTHINGVFVHALRADGLIVATPTGSTAYALSGGGPILHPCLPAMVLVPINPHTLSNRPIVVDAGARIEITFRPGKSGNAQLCCDNHTLPPVAGDARIVIERAPHPARVLHPEGHDFYQILRAKLNWSH